MVAVHVTDAVAQHAAEASQQTETFNLSSTSSNFHR
jgi:hypothetical protein